MSGTQRTGLLRVALVGRPNVGKSALFNRLTGRRRALVHDRPGMTRDALEAPATTGSGRSFVVIDTGGLDLDAVGGFAAWTRERALAAVADSDLLLLVLDGTAGLLPEDRRVAARLRALGKPVAVVWNKADVRLAAEAAAEAYELGFREVVAVSAIHGTGMEDLDAILEARLPAELDPGARDEPLAVAVVGRPNVGKSSLVNALAGADRVMVSEIPGTTRDSIDVVLTKGERAYLLVDTAGMRRKGKTTDSAEKLSVVAARKSLERARVAVVVFDASEGITAQDAHVAGYAEEAGRALILVANKWDLIEKDREKIRSLRDDVKRRFVFMRTNLFLPVSARTGRGVGKILPEVDAVARRFATRMPTGELNRILHRAFDRQAPTGRSGRDLKIRYAVQVRSEPPAVRLFADRAEALHFSFERYLQNRLREAFPLDGVPVKFEVTRSD
ncbi:MAG: ribosome biogenesis GTPase Der [Thermoanaerobaculia bacterium]